MIRQFKVILMSIEKGLIEHIVNCNDEISARYICEGIFPKMGIIEITENK